MQPMRYQKLPEWALGREFCTFLRHSIPGSTLFLRQMRPPAATAVAVNVPVLSMGMIACGRLTEMRVSCRVHDVEGAVLGV